MTFIDSKHHYHLCFIYLICHPETLTFFTSFPSAPAVSNAFTQDMTIAREERQFPTLHWPFFPIGLSVTIASWDTPCGSLYVTK